MNKSQLVDKISSGADISKKEAKSALDSILSSTQSALASGESVVLIGFGTFSVKERKERQGKNPQTGEPMTIAAAKVPTWKGAKNLLTK